MKNLMSAVLFAAEGVALYLWQACDIESAGRILIFYLWAMGLLALFVSVLAFIGAASVRFNVPAPKQTGIRYVWGWTMIVARVGVLVAIAHPALAGVYLIGNLLARLVNALCRDGAAAGGA